MELKAKRSTTLFRLYLKYLTVFCLLILTTGLVMLIVFNSLQSNGLILSANYQEKMIYKNTDAIASSLSFDESLIPYPATYALIDKNGKVLKTSMSDGDTESAKKLLSQNAAPPWYYKTINRSDSTCVIKYDVVPHFSSKELNEKISNPELLFFIMFFVIFILLAALSALLFRKRLRNELVPIKTATEKISGKDLDFEITSTKIKEFNDVLASIDGMKTALKASLSEQWSAEQRKSTQIAALAHDIKTPLTIVKGNAQLLLESNLDNAQMDMSEAINRSSDKIERYTRLLINTIKGSDSSDFNPDDLSLKDFTNDVETSAIDICRKNGCRFTLINESDSEKLSADKEKLMRALLNIIDNAAEHSGDNGAVSLKISDNEDSIVFTVEDSGPGFTPESATKATELFYTEGKERSGLHYGMGLYIAASVAALHGGRLTVTPSAHGIVTLSIAV